MNVIVTIRIRGNVDQFRRFVHDSASRLKPIADAARAAGCVHHRFGIGPDFVLVVDEWTSKEAFQTFFQTNRDLPGVMKDAGAQAPPEFEFTEAITTSDQF